MKTVCISAFEGNEVKNLLRTPVVSILLKDQDVRIVLLTKNAERKDFLLREFSHERIAVEIVPYDRWLGSGLDRLFGFLKFLLLRTDTTIMRRRIRLRAEGGRVRFLINTCFNALFARPIVRRTVRFLDFALVQNNAHREWFDRIRPDLVFLAHLFDEPEMHVLREAKRRGIKTVGYVNSWDKVTARCMMRLLPDKVIVFNDIVKEEMIAHNEVRPEDIFVSGIPQYDAYFTHRQAFVPRDAFFKRYGFDLQKKLLVYAPVGRAFSSIDWELLDLLSALMKREKFDNEVELLVRFQPNDPPDEQELRKRSHLSFDVPGKVFSATRGVDWDMSEEELRHLHSTLATVDILVCYASSLSIDAAIFDKPVININFDPRPLAVSEQSPTMYYATEHYKKALAAGGISLADSPKDLAQLIRAYLTDPSYNHPGRKALVASQCQFEDGRSSERIAGFVREML